MSRARTIRRWVLRALAAVAVVAVVAVAWQAVELYLAWRKFDHLEFDPDASRSALPSLPSTSSTSTTEPAEPRPPLPPEFRGDESAIDVFLLLGSDEDKPTAEALRADAVLMFLRPRQGSQPVLMSFPRDLYLANPCSGERTRISELLDGCGDEINGPELLALTLEDFTGLKVDHFAVISFNGFRAIIDELGGIRVCVQIPTRLGPLELPQGCTVINGGTALYWLRERAPFELVDGEWTAAPAGDLARIERQRALMIELLQRLRGFRSPLELSDVVSDLSDAFVLDESLDLPRAIGMAWDLRRVRPAELQQVTLPVVDEITEDGEFVRLPGTTFDEVLRSVYLPEESTASS